MSKTEDRRQAKRAARLPQRQLRTASRAAADPEAAAPVVPDVPPLDLAAPKQADPIAGSALLELADGSRVSHPNRGDGRRILVNGAVFDIAGTLEGVPVFRFVLQEPLPG